jgi:hypothetical protein
MYSMYLAVVLTASTILMLVLPKQQATTTLLPEPKPEIIFTDDQWNQKAIQWLIDAQSPNGGWGAGSHAFQNVNDPHAVQTDPATTAFAATALLKSGGKLTANPHQQEIMKALDRILKDIDVRPDNGRITSLSGTQPQVKLGIHIDASMALQFLTMIREDISDVSLQEKIDKAANVCISLIQSSQNSDGGWAGGGWAPVLQSAMANNALEVAQGRYDVDEKAIENSRKYQAANVAADGVRSEDAAGIPLYAVASAQRATAVEAREVENAFAPGTLSSISSKGEGTVSKALQENGMEKEKADRLAKSYSVNQSSSKQLASDEIWTGFGNDGGEEYLSYMMTSEAMAQQGQEKLADWLKQVEPKFKNSQNPNGSWSGQHCITSPVFCTAAVIQAWKTRA